MREFRNVNPYLARKKCDEIWEEWQAFLEQEKRKSFRRLLIGIKTGKYAEAIQDIEERSKNIGKDLFPDVFRIYGNPTHQNGQWILVNLLTELQISHRLRRKPSWMV